MAVDSKVLLVEDSKFLRLANERALSKAGYQVSTAADGEEAVRVANNKLPDVILLDMLLPKLSGPEVLKALKGNPATREIPVIVLTSLSKKNEEKLLHEGATAYFEKSSLDLDKGSGRLAAAVETVLQQLNRRRELDQLLRETASLRGADIPEVATPTAAPVDASVDTPTDDWEIEVVAIESIPCTTTIPPPPSKS